MGRAQCHEHPDNASELCCDHVRLGANTRSGWLPFERYRLDWQDDGGTVSTLFVCDHCAHRFGLSPDRVVTGEDIEMEGRLPNLVPTCNECLAAWRDQA